MYQQRMSKETYWQLHVNADIISNVFMSPRIFCFDPTNGF